ncbi:MAG: adenylyltransferase/cytidyltransferase family protein [bacterium]
MTRGLGASAEELLAWRKSVGGGADRVAVVGGTFHILQPGNIAALRQARLRARHVCVLVEPDNAGGGRPGKRPDVSLAERMEMLAHLKDVDIIASATAPAAGDILQALRPYSWVRCNRQVDGPLAQQAADLAERHEPIPLLPGCFTPDILAAIRSGSTPMHLPHAFRGRRGAKVGRGRKRRLVTINGCFDVLHIGHLRFLAQARAKGDELVVLINNDESVRRYKGDDRPVFPLRFRAAALLALKSVTAVRSFHEDNPLRLISELKPDIHVKGGTYEPDRVDAERRLLATWGGRVAFCQMVEGRSTTGYLTKVGNTPGLTAR